uniref:uncharacterized protein LOC122599354 n=1 Tax=Erigeron canadensis TaxID=72917 RepID=UPI001CB97CFA|nr:uncharacterized protein LOC122599354 [Erigeron canadensis]
MAYFSSESKSSYISSLNRKSLFLQDWWLIKVQPGSKLGVGGFANKEKVWSRGRRVSGSVSAGKNQNHNTLETGIQAVCSLPIAKRLDYITLEAENGVIVMISGCINRSRTLSFGFSPEVCDHFRFGFPSNWKECTAKSSQEKCANLPKKLWEKCAKTKERSFPESFDDLPVTRVQDLLLTTEESESSVFTCIYRNILKQCTQDSFNQSASSVRSDKEISMNSKEAELDHNPDGEDGLENSKETESEYKQKEDDYTLNETPKLTKIARANERNTTRVSGHKRNPTSPLNQYQLRSARTSKSS